MILFCANRGSILSFFRFYLSIFQSLFISLICSVTYDVLGRSCQRINSIIRFIVHSIFHLFCLFFQESKSVIVETTLQAPNERLNVLGQSLCIGLLSWSSAKDCPIRKVNLPISYANAASRHFYDSSLNNNTKQRNLINFDVIVPFNFTPRVKLLNGAVQLGKRNQRSNQNGRSSFSGARLSVGAQGPVGNCRW